MILCKISRFHSRFQLNDFSNYQGRQRIYGTILNTNTKTLRIQGFQVHRLPSVIAQNPQYPLKLITEILKI